VERQVSDLFRSYFSVPEDVIPLIQERLEKPDCKLNGYILDGCPISRVHILKLEEHGIIPSLIVALNQND
jgi:adenylate kinase family enzyme